ncbi:gp27 [Lomovskayavirus C31]|uniref:Gp27 n=2 Tax=root TaxID=1 RepID=Q9T220_BPPHC|nr:gp27 [Lomovskayavirus C31]AFH74316.1 gp27 [Cosmid vector pOJ436]CAA07151.1 gp27 [Lomovskayavirus C31]
MFPMRRYRVTQRPPEWRQELQRTEDGNPPVVRPWVIFDGAMKGYCALPDDGDPSTLMPLEWVTQHGAQAWLMRCYRTWGEVPLVGGGAVPYNVARERVGR